MNIVLGTLIVAVTIYFLFRDYDPRVILIASGLLMAGIALDPLTVLDEFANKMVTDSLIQAICASLGFGFIMKETGCEARLFSALSRIQGYGLIVIPTITLLTFFVNALFMSAANTAAALGCVLIPLLIRSGIHPVIAAAAILTGTFGSMLNPELPINSFLADISGTTAQAVVQNHGLGVVLGIAAGAGCLTLVAKLRNEYAGYGELETAEENNDNQTRNWAYAVVPLVPLVILILGSSGIVPVLRIGVAQAMLVGILVALLVTRTSPATVAEKFFSGMGNAYASAMGLVIAAGVFVQGMKSIGLISFFITWLTTTPGIAKFSAAFGPFFMGAITGSGDAAAFAFSEAVAPHAFLYSMDTSSMGSLAAIAGALGRTMSPLAGATIVCAAIAGVNPTELIKRNSMGILAALVLTYGLL